MWTGDPENWFGRLYCHGCHSMQYFVSWEPELRGSEHAECRECGWKFPVVEETIVDPETHLPVTRRRSTLDPEVLAAARAELRREFIRDARAAAMTDGVPFDPRKLSRHVGPDSTNSG